MQPTAGGAHMGMGIVLAESYPNIRQAAAQRGNVAAAPRRGVAFN